MATKYHKPQEVLRGTMWWANIPKDECNPHAQYGLRPVVIISNDVGNAHSPSVLVCTLTTREDKYKMIHPNVMCTGTLSYVQCEQIKVLDKQLLGQYIGKVRDVEQDFIDRALATAIDLSHYLKDGREAQHNLEAAQAKIAELEARIAELEAEKGRNKIDEDTYALGQHVRGIMNIFAKDIRIPVSQPIPSVAQNNIIREDKPSSQPAAQASEPDKQESKSKIRTTSQIDKFNSRSEKQRQLLASQLESDAKLTPIAKDDKLARVNATKWDDQTISKFVSDYKELPEGDLLKKYDLRNMDTARKYYSKFIKHESL